MNLFIIFITGLTTGGLSCLAVQGGLLAGVIANQKENELDKVNHEAVPVSQVSRKARKKSKYLKSLAQSRVQLQAKSFDRLDWMPVSLFLLAKLVAYTILGFFLGWVGQRLQLTDTMRLIFQGLAALFMFGTAMNLLDVHPIFRYLVLQPPRFIRKWLKSSTTGKAFFTPAVLGLMTVLIPCGVTQSMEVLAISSGSPIAGATILFAFVLGTSPIFGIIGVATAKLSEVFRDRFLKIAATALIVMSLMSLNGILVVLNSPVTFSKLAEPIIYFFSEERFERTQSQASLIENGQQVVQINVTDSGYAPNYFKVKAGTPVRLTVSTQNTYSCASSFLMKSFNISFQLAPTDSQTAVFTPTQKGKYPFNCSMGMYKGVMEVI